MGKNDFDFDDFLMFKMATKGGGCLITTLSILGTVVLTAVLAAMIIF